MPRRRALSRCRPVSRGTSTAIFKVDGNDAALFDAALGSKIGDPNYKPAADTSHDGEVTLDDRIFLDVNFGFASHQAPALSNGTALTHKDLPLIFDLTTLASNSAEPALTYRLIGTAHGTARISPDGASLIFTPEASFSGAANFQIQAADSLATSTAATVTVNVSSAACWIGLQMAPTASGGLARFGRCWCWAILPTRLKWFCRRPM